MAANKPLKIGLCYVAKTKQNKPVKPMKTLSALTMGTNPVISCYPHSSPRALLGLLLFLHVLWQMAPLSTQLS